MISKSFIAYACLVGFTTSINAQRIASDRNGGHARAPDHDVHARDAVSDALSGSKILKYHGGILGIFPSSPFSFPTSTALPNVVEYRDLEALADRSHHKFPSSSPTNPPHVVEKRGLEVFAEKELDNGKAFLDERLHQLMRRLKVVTPEYKGHSSAPPQPKPSDFVVGYRDLGSLVDDYLDSREESISDDSQDFVQRLKDVTSGRNSDLSPTPTKVVQPLPTAVGSPPDVAASDFADAHAHRPVAINERSIDDESQNLNRRLKITSGNSLPFPPSTPGEINVVGYRDLDGLVDRALADRSIIDTLLNYVHGLKGSGDSTPTSSPAANNRRRANSRTWSSRRSVNLS